MQTAVRIIQIWALTGTSVLFVIVGISMLNTIGFSANAAARLWGGSIPGLAGYEDAVSMLIGTAALMMFPYCQLTGGHISVDILMQKAPAAVRQTIIALCNILAATLALWLAYMLALGMMELRSDRTETAVLGWPVWVFLPSAVISCVLWALAALIPLLWPSQANTHGA